MPSPSVHAHPTPAAGHRPGADPGHPGGDPAAELCALLVQLQAVVPKAHPDLLRAYVVAIESVRDGWWAGACAGCGLHIDRRGG